MQTAAQVSTTVTEIQTVATTILGILAAVDPGIGVPSGIAEQILVIVGKGLAAYTAAAGVEVTPATVLALLPDPTPLSPAKE
jgi:hypothetical protein